MLSTRKKTKITISLAAVLLLAQAACAENVLSASFVICNNDTVRLNHLTLEDGYPTKYLPQGDDRLELLNTQGEIIYNISLDVKFILFSDPPVRVNCSLISIRIPYDAQMRSINIYRKENLIYSQELKLCNNDGVCDPVYETNLSCPHDCAGLTTTTTTIPSKGNEKPLDILSYLPYVIVLIVLVIAAYFIRKKSDDAKIKKERDEFLKWKDKKD